MSIEITTESAVKLANGSEVLSAFVRKGVGIEPAEIGVVLARSSSTEFCVWSIARSDGQAFNAFHGEYFPFGLGTSFGSADAMRKAQAFFQKRVVRELGIVRP